MNPLKDKVNKRINKLIGNLAKDFAVDKLSKSPARFNLEKLQWFNREYIKMMALEEFAYRASLNKISQKHLGKKLRVGDYAYLVDLDKQQIFMENHDKIWEGTDSKFFPLGGGRELETLASGEKQFESYELNLSREIWEESDNQLKIDSDKLLFIGIRQHVYEEPANISGEVWDGKEYNYYFYPVSINNLKKCKGDLHNLDGDLWCDWIDLKLVIESNKFLNYPIWRNFCLENGLPCFEPTEKIRQQYLAWYLDKNRITVLSELGSESDCILNWVKPNPADLKWKKISLEESLANLREINEHVIQSEAKDPEAANLKTKLYESVLTPELETNYQNSVAYFETKIKAWLTENNKDAGSYLWPLRLALSGKTKSPSPFELLTVLSPDQIEDRIQQCLA